MALMTFRTNTVVVIIVALVAVLSAVASAAPANQDPAATRKLLESYWADLKKSEPEASRALLGLASRPSDTVPFLKEKMKPLTLDAARARALLADLGSDKEEVAKTAFAELQYFDPRLAIDLETLMREVTQNPARQRMVEALSGWSFGSLQGKEIDLRRAGPDGFNFFVYGLGTTWAEHKVERLIVNSGNHNSKWTRAIRAIELLRYVGSPDAVAILKGMASGHPEAQPTNVAKEALKAIGGNAP